MDSRFKTLAHLSRGKHNEVIKDISNELVVYVSSGEKCENVAVTEVREAETDVTEESALRRKPRLTSIEKLLGKQCEDQSAGAVRLCRLR